MKKGRTKTLWTREYYSNGSLAKAGSQGDFAVRKVLTYPIGYYQPTERFEVSISSKRTSWYKDHYNLMDAKRFGNALIKNKS